ncbi:MAG: 3-deoxy-D-arabino-heptulosonate 7-phosphate synthase [Pigmentiphaga sp.]|uniref:3-deoxy-D-arabino-heptulosonate 7-phosphate synthase n=1 Tax=Pigmentiphaga sp. TaxID=1977564 RepID=UPI0029A12990|nr:3-deoxy-D-arabino-heptulosonate 7-phosphate synthase [Pigmentiphaga sp.]MDX3905679.1 3-deoxy-D-arabino-heptulosonate 7-phosphate synthase [Pigmentiphaga sp.]
MDPASVSLENAGPATLLAATIEQARQAAARGEMPDAAVQRHFVEALSQIIRDALREESGDPAFQAMVLRHRAAAVREYASLVAHAGRDRRVVGAAVNRIAHPAKLRRHLAGERREALADLHASACAGSWSAVEATVRGLLAMPDVVERPSLVRDLMVLQDSPALARLLRLEALVSDEQVRRYRALWDRHGPRSGSPTAVAQGVASQRRGAAVEALATQAVEALARRLEQDEGRQGVYRVVTAMHVPASLAANRERAKTEWDAVLLRQAKTVGDAPAWDLCLLVEAKASVDAATTDYPRLLRGLRLLAQAQAGTVYAFKTRQGMVCLRGESLSALPTTVKDLTRTVLYCSNAPAETGPRLLSAASRMQLLSAPASLAFAAALIDGSHADPRDLDSIWRELWTSPRWAAVLCQYPAMLQVRELMVHTEDLSAAVGGTTDGAAGRA